MKLNVRFLPALAVLAGCSTTKVIPRGEPFNLEGKATLVSTDKKLLVIRSAKTVGDSLAVSEFHTRKEFRLSLGSIEKIVVVDRIQGMTQGAGIGVLAGSVLGFAAGSVGTDKCEMEQICIPEGVVSIFSAIGGGFLGAWIGGALGAMAGHRRNFVPKNISMETGRPESLPNGSVDSGRFSQVHPDSLKSDTLIKAGAETVRLASPSPGSGIFDSLEKVYGVHYQDSLAKTGKRAKDSVRTSRKRSKVYAGVELGLGLGFANSSAGNTSGNGPFGSLAFGATLNPKWVVGLGLSRGWLEEETSDANGINFKENHSRSVWLEASYYPHAKGRFFRGALGGSTFGFKNGRSAPVQASDAGLIISSGMGHAFNLWKGVSLTLNADLVASLFMHGANGFMLKPSIGVYWY